MKYTKVFYNPTVTIPSQVDHKERQCTKDAAVVGNTAKAEAPIPQNRVNFWVSHLVPLRRLLVSQLRLFTHPHTGSTQRILLRDLTGSRTCPKHTAS